MARLKDVVADIVANLSDGGTLKNVKSIASNRYEDVDEDGQYILGVEGLAKRIRDAAKSLKLKAASLTGAQQEMLPFDLPGAVPMDIDGATIRPTRDLSRDEFARAIEIRQQQIVHDTARLKEWRDALAAADRYWSRFPDWTFGQCLDAIVMGAPANDNGSVSYQAA